MAVYFSLFLVIATIVTGIVWCLDKYRWAPARQLRLADAQAQCQGELTEEAVEAITQPNDLIDTSVQVFPIFAFILILRSFLYEPFQIPSGSMMPTLLDGDFILVNKFNYGLRDPVGRYKFFDIGAPERGDVVVFKYPVQPEIDYIKRVVGLPGDTIIYRNKTLYIKKQCTSVEQTCPKFEKVIKDFNSDDESYGLSRYHSTMLGKNHDILIDHNVPAEQQAFEFCRHSAGNLCYQPGTEHDEYIVPKGHYFVLGDNRDNSLDSRFWGFVPEENLVGEAVAIWMSFDFERGEDSVLPHWVPTGIRFNRLGGIN